MSADFMVYRCLETRSARILARTVARHDEERIAKKKGRVEAVEERTLGHVWDASFA